MRACRGRMRDNGASGGLIGARYYIRAIGLLVSR